MRDSSLGVLDAHMNQPAPYGAFHIVWLLFVIATIITLCVLYKKEIIKNVNRVLIVTTVVLAVFELYKQINVISVGYNFDYFPLRFNTMLLYIGIVAGMTKGKFHDNLTAFISTYLLFIGSAVMLNPSSVFANTIGFNVCAMVSYGAMVLVGAFLLYTNEVKIKFSMFWKALPIFTMFWLFSTSVNIVSHLVASRFVSTFGFNFLSSCPLCDNHTPAVDWLHEAIVGSNPSTLACVLYSFAYAIFFSLLALATTLLLVGIKKLLTTDFDAEYGETDEIAKEIRKAEGLDGKDDDNNGIFKFAEKVNTKKNTYLQTYYKNLVTNFGNNVENSCGYVAVAMLLSYYDTILHDKIVPRRFDKPSRSDDAPNFEESPGIKYFDHPEFHPDDPNNKITYARYKQLVNQNKNTYLHEALVAIGIKLGINKAPKDKLTTDFDFSTDNDKREKLIKYYLKHVARVEKSEYDIHSVDYVDEIAEAETEAEVLKYSRKTREYIIKKIKKGYPVIISVAKLNENGQYEGHAIVAYDYDKKNDKIYCHMGIAGESTHATPEEYGYTLYRSAMVLDFDENKLSHSHTNNYEVVINGAIFYYCPDGTYTTCDDLIIEFNKTKDQCAIIGVYGKYYSDELYIPERYGFVEVTKIHKYAFANQRHIKIASIPSSIKVIEKGTFKNNASLELINISGKLRRIKKDAFKGCYKLDNIMYRGRTSQWDMMKKSRNWDRGTGRYRVSCIDGFYVKRLGRDLEVNSYRLLGVTKDRDIE